MRLWVLNTLPAHWERCREGPTDADHDLDARYLAYHNDEIASF